MKGQYVGNVAHWIPARAFGFVFCDELSRRVFFHIAHWHRSTPPVVGEVVTFNLSTSAIEGKPDKAVDVTPVTPAPIRTDVRAAALALLSGKGGVS
jgi:cold shock CspA family protein